MCSSTDYKVKAILTVQVNDIVTMLDNELRIDNIRSRLKGSYMCLKELGQTLRSQSRSWHNSVVRITRNGMPRINPALFETEK